MPAYFIAEVEVLDPAPFQEYVQGAPATVRQYGGEYVARGGAIEVLEGSWHPKRLTIIRFESVARAKELVSLGAQQVIIGTAAFSAEGVNEKFLRAVRRAVGKRRVVLALDTMRGRIVVKGWRASTGLRPEDVIAQIEPYCGSLLCTYVDKEEIGRAHV